MYQVVESFHCSFSLRLSASLDARRTMYIGSTCSSFMGSLVDTENFKFKLVALGEIHNHLCLTKRILGNVFSVRSMEQTIIVSFLAGF